jgi:alkanesulfonate monooxygenase SsuD/methylene tetrahydromethanopterin reductase-like flavin-dependent oxidoreductase (luciferase family)
MVTPKPFQDPHPDPWMAGGLESAIRAGENGFGFLSLTILQSLEASAVNWAAYREAVARCTKPATRILNPKLAVYTLVHCADSMEQAEEYGVWESVWWWYKHLAEFTLQWEMEHLDPDSKMAAFPYLFEERASSGEWSAQVFNQEDMVIVGDPDMCYEKMVKYAEHGVDELICYMQFGYLPHEAVMRSIELIGTKLRPELEKLGIQVDPRIITPRT